MKSANLWLPLGGFLLCGGAVAQTAQTPQMPTPSGGSLATAPPLATDFASGDGKQRYSISLGGTQAALRSRLQGQDSLTETALSQNYTAGASGSAFGDTQITAKYHKKLHGAFGLNSVHWLGDTRTGVAGTDWKLGLEAALAPGLFKGFGIKSGKFGFSFANQAHVVADGLPVKDFKTASVGGGLKLGPIGFSANRTHVIGGSATESLLTDGSKVLFKSGARQTTLSATSDPIGRLRGQILAYDTATADRTQGAAGVSAGVLTERGTAFRLGGESVPISLVHKYQQQLLPGLPVLADERRFFLSFDTQDERNGTTWGIKLHSGSKGGGVMFTLSRTGILGDGPARQSSSFANTQHRLAGVGATPTVEGISGPSMNDEPGMQEAKLDQQQRVMNSEMAAKKQRLEQLDPDSLEASRLRNEIAQLDTQLEDLSAETRNIELAQADTQFGADTAEVGTITTPANPGAILAGSTTITPAAIMIGAAISVNRMAELDREKLAKGTTPSTSATTATTAPTASNATIAGTVKVGQTLTGSYTYADANGDPQGTSTFRWLRNGVAIGGATASTYALVNADLGATITFEVTPVATVAPTTGTAVASAATAGVTLPAGYVSQGGLVWMPNNVIPNSGGGVGVSQWANANTYCTTATILGQTGWRLPTTAELLALDNSGAITGQGWTVTNTWTSTLAGGGHDNVLMGAGISGWDVDTQFMRVTCVR